MSDPFQKLEQLAAARGRKAKRAVLVGCDGLVRDLLAAAVDPWRCYYVTDVEPAASSMELRGAQAAVAILSTLSVLATGTVRGSAGAQALSALATQLGRVELSWLVRIVRRKLGIGVGPSAVNAVWPGTIREFVLPLCESLEARRVNGRYEWFGKFRPTYPALGEPKLDGLRIYAVRRSGSWLLFTRGGELVETMPGAARDLAVAIPTTWGDVDVHGEAFDGDWSSSASSVMSKRKRDPASDGPTLQIFDVHLLGCAETLEVRRQRVDSLPSDLPSLRTVPAVRIETDDELFALYEERVAAGDEGLVVKRLDAVPHVDRSDAWLKLKPKATWEGIVVGSFLGRKGTRLERALGGLEFRLPNSEVVSEVGSGFSDAMRFELANVDLVGRWIEVEGQPPLTPDGRVRFPTFVRFRDPSDLG